MKKTFEIKRSKGRCIVFSLSNDRLDSIFQDVCQSLEKKHYSGDVIFDLLLPNGLSDNRYISISFKKNNFDLTTMCMHNPFDRELLTISNTFYSHRRHLITESILPRTQKQLIIKELEKTL